ncbi:hypothetical protein PAXRUDRAFT_168338, partial [Paxillus rubicundulus Ve08.2h10]
VVVPGAKCFVDGGEFFVMSVIVEFQSSEGSGVEHDQAEFVIRATDGKDASNGVVGGISLNDDRGIRHLMHQHRSRGEGIFQAPESRAAFIGERNNDVGVVINEMMVEFGETEE